MNFFTKYRSTRSAFGFLLFLIGIKAPCQQQGFDTAGLEKRIYHGLKRYNVPGLSIALIKDSIVFFQGGYGKSNGLSGTPITPTSLFSVASLSKPVTAFTMMHYLNDAGISLDSTLHKVQPSDTLFSQDPKNKITFRQLMCHTAGYSNFLRDKERRLLFTPGSAYSYSGVGYMVLQEFITAQSKMSLDELADKYLFSANGMGNTFFGDNKEEEQVVAGHSAFLRVLMPFLIPFSVVFLGLIIIMLVISKIRKRSMSTLFLTGIPILISSVAALLFLQTKAGEWRVPLYFTGVGLSIVLAIFFILVLISGITKKYFASKISRSLIMVLTVAAMGLFIFLNRDYAIPILNMKTERGNAAASLRSNAADMSQFILRLLKDYRESDPLLKEMVRPQININKEEDWALGLGLRKIEGTTFAWHWGSNPGNRAIIVIDFKNQTGFVILSNSGNAKGLLEDLTTHLLGSKEPWKV